ncbi:MAG: CADD family putative folate metabolism protein [Bacteroidota bacterium]|nr:CADD family putative folate metabolism protein [Bacteroidota bacterium]MDP4230007.1 CADD family putative folate metabolism protein [Bacteroidota bacterium]MDP4237688.1 CADD family putative folate metabolism protein [Bacteroidota bacterium]
MTTNFLARLDAAIAQYAVLDHPFYQAWNAGTLTNPQLQDYAKQYYHFERNFPRYVSNVHANTTDIAIRQQLLLNLQEEEQGEANHPELWLRFSEALGCDRTDVTHASPYKETAAMEDTFVELTRHGSTLQGVAALYGYESQIPEVSRTKIEGLTKYYGVNSDKGLAFFRVHEEADQIHRQAERDMLASLITSPADEETAIAAAAAAAKAYYHMLTGVVRENAIECTM